MPRIIVALDFDSSKKALSIVDRLEPDQCRLKVGMQLYTSEGPSIVEKLQKKGFDVFLDLKYHDIPNTVAATCRAAADLGVWMVNVHALGGRRMLVAAREAIETCQKKPLLIGVTLLTSHDQEEIRWLSGGGRADVTAFVSELALLAHDAGLDGIVCSGREAAATRKLLGKNFVLVTPGIRLEEAGDDQRRILTPEAAIKAGSDYLVMGRPIVQASDPIAILSELNSRLSKIDK